MVSKPLPDFINEALQIPILCQCHWGIVHETNFEWGKKKKKRRVIATSLIASSNCRLSTPKNLLWCRSCATVGSKCPAFFISFLLNTFFVTHKSFFFLLHSPLNTSRSTWEQSVGYRSIANGALGSPGLQYMKSLRVRRALATLAQSKEIQYKSCNKSIQDSMCPIGLELTLCFDDCSSQWCLAA